MGKSTIFTRIQFGSQSSFEAEAATPNEIKGKLLNFTPINENGLIKERGLGDGRNVINTLLGPYNCGGSLSWHVADWDFLQYWIGPMSGSGTAGDHFVLTEADVVGFNAPDIVPFSLEVNSPEGITDDVDTYIGGVGNTFNLTGSIGTPVTATGDFVARTVVSNTSGTAYTPTTIDPWMMHQGTWKWGATPDEFIGLQSFSILFSNNLIIERDAANRFISQPVTDARDYDFTITVVTTADINTRMRDDFYGQANTPTDGVLSASPIEDIEFKVEFSQGLASGNRNATLWLDQASIDIIGKPIALGGNLVVYNITGHAKDGRSTTPIEWWNI